jgi:PST family polysaccharide transporter
MTAETRPSTARGTLWLGAVNLIGKSCQMVLTFALAAFLAPGDLGLIALAVSVVTIGQVVQSMGVFDVIARTQGDPDRMAGTVLTLSVGLGGALAVVAFAGAEWIAAGLGAPHAAPLVRIVVLSLPFTALAGVQMGVMHRALEFHRRALPDIGSAVLGAGIAISLAAAGSGPYSLPLGLLISAIAQPLLAVVAGVRVRPCWDRRAAAEAIRWVRVVGPGAVVAILLLNVGYVMIGNSGSETVGVYALAFRIALVPYLVVTLVLSSVAFPLYTRMMREGSHGELPGAVLRLTHLTVITAGGLYLVIALLAPHVVVIDAHWAPSAGALVLLCVYGVADSLMQPWYSALRAAGHPRWFLILQSVQLLALVVLLAALVPGGAQGAATAHLAAAWLIVPVLWMVMRKAGLAPRASAVVRVLRGPIIAAVVCWLAHVVIVRTPLLADPGNLVGAVVEGLVLVCVYGGVLYLLDDITREHLRRLYRARR